ncbi:hypothetical protein ANO11243_003040 [Dothideomycetidae sp. 11243]|nr:hypothetical protein ANO11243_003040 [fungal sp. No.11243]
MSSASPPSQPLSPSATAAATSAASGQYRKAKRPVLQTLVPALYPSEIGSPLSAIPTQTCPREHLPSGKPTPISPPAAYRDFLKAASPAIISPLTTCDPLSRSESSISTEAGNGSDNSSLPPAKAEPEEVKQPQISRHVSSDSAASLSSITTSTSLDSQPATAPDHNSADSSKHKPPTPRITIPTKAGFRPLSAHTPRRLNIPCSPLSAGTMHTPGSTQSLASARSLRSPWSASSSVWASSAGGTAQSPRSIPSAKDLHASPRDHRHPLVPFCVREVVTRTVTYARSSTPLSAPPRGKRRKTAVDGESGTAPPWPSLPPPAPSSSSTPEPADDDNAAT